jgi:hypothetical protein
MSRYDESSMSSLSANQSAYNAVEPKPMSSNQSQRSRQSNVGPASVSNNSYRQPRSVDGRSAQSVASGLSHGSAGRSGSRNNRNVEDDERSSNTMSLIGQVNDLTTGSQFGEQSYRSSSSRQSKGGNSRQSSRDPDANSVRSNNNNLPPPPPRSVKSGYTSRRTDPSGLSHEYGADDPDGLHYAPGIRNHIQPPSRGPPSVNSRSVMSEYEEQSMQSSRASSRSGTYYDETIREEEDSYYSQSQSSRGSSTMRSNAGRGLSAEASQFTGRGDDESYYSKGSNASRSAFTSKKVS